MGVGISSLLASEKGTSPKTLTAVPTACASKTLEAP
jgi:hypothetical protein